MASTVNNRIVVNVDFLVGFNETFDQVFDFTNADGTPFDLTDWAFTFKVYKGNQVVETLTEGNGFAILYDSRFVFNHLFQIAPGCDYTYKLNGSNEAAGDKIKTFMQGKINVES